MTVWAERAKAYFLHEQRVGTPKTPEMPVMGVLGVGPLDLQENEGGFWGVLGVASRPIPKKAHPEDERLLEALLTAAMRACDHHGDGSAAREQMRAACIATSPHLRGDLLDHFNQTYPQGRK